MAERVGRRRLLIVGWAFALPVPVLIATAPSWGFIVAANALLGINQGLAWSMTVVMKIDLVGPRRRGLALGLNESAGYGGVALAAGLSGWLAASLAARDVVVVAGAVIAIVALVLSLLFVRDTAAHVSLEQARDHAGEDGAAPTLREAFAKATYREPSLRACSQAGLVNNLNDAVAWGVVPLFLAAGGASASQVGLVAGLYPAVWGLGQIWTGHWSDRVVGVARELTGALNERGGFDAAIVSDLPVGAGLSSSGALEVATAMALLAAWRTEMPACAMIVVTPARMPGFAAFVGTISIAPQFIRGATSSIAYFSQRREGSCRNGMGRRKHFPECKG